jgi:hypothetical protein
MKDIGQKEALRKSSYEIFHDIIGDGFNDILPEPQTLLAGH